MNMNQKCTRFSQCGIDSPKATKVAHSMDANIGMAFEYCTYKYHAILTYMRM